MPIVTNCKWCSGALFLIPDMVISKDDNFSRIFQADCKCGHSYAGIVQAKPGDEFPHITISVVEIKHETD